MAAIERRVFSSLGLMSPGRAATTRLDDQAAHPPGLGRPGRPVRSDGCAPVLRRNRSPF